MTKDELIALRDRIRAKKTPTYTELLIVNIGNDGNYYYDNLTSVLMTPTDRRDWEYYRVQDLADFVNNSRRIIVSDTGYHCQSQLDDDTLSHAVNSYDWGRKNGRIRVYRLD